MTRNEKTFLKRLERAQREIKADLKRLEAFNAKFPGQIRADKLRKIRLRHVYTSMTLRTVINTFHEEIVKPRTDRYVHVSVVERLRKEVEELRQQVAERELIGV